jgi:hypothetical protein
MVAATVQKTAKSEKFRLPMAYSLKDFLERPEANPIQSMLSRKMVIMILSIQCTALTLT